MRLVVRVQQLLERWSEPGFVPTSKDNHEIIQINKGIEEALIDSTLSLSDKYDLAYAIVSFCLFNTRMNPYMPEFDASAKFLEFCESFFFGKKHAQSLQALEEAYDELKKQDANHIPECDDVYCLLKQWWVEYPVVFE